MSKNKKTSARGETTIPFPAIVGQDELKQALLAIGANETLNGLLIQGEKGTAKSTAVRAMADLLPEQTVVADCPYGCPPDEPANQCADCRDRPDPETEQRPVPLVTLPLGATRERVVGTLSVEKALDGNPEFDPGLLARANRGILYVDEVNLLDDHLVDVILDAAASGVNRVERDGVSVSHPAQFTLVGTMNPEEGDLRPQLRDRFDLQATVTGQEDIEDRVRIIDRVLGEERAAETVDHDAEQAAVVDLQEDLVQARELLPTVELPTEFAEEIAELCRDAGVDGHRADIATARTALTFAALDGRPTVIESDVCRAAELALPHRLQSKPFEDAPDPEDLIDDHFDDEDGDDAGEDDDQESGADDDEQEPEGDGGGDDGESGSDEDGESGADGDEDERPDRQSQPDEPPDESDDGGSEEDTDSGPDGDGDGTDTPTPAPSSDDGSERESEADDGDGDDGEEENETEEGTPLLPGQSRPEATTATAPDIDVPSADGEAAVGGTRSGVEPSASNHGARVRTQPAESGEQVDAAASVRAAVTRGSTTVESRDLRQSVRAGDTSALVVFAVDASASMRGPMRLAKGVAIDLLRDAYEQRDEVSLVTFAGEEAQVVLPPTDNVTLAARHLKELPTGNRTPLPAGLRTAGEVLQRADPAVGIVVLVTDGRANTADGSPTGETREAARQLAEQGTHVVVVDAGSDSRTTLAGEIATVTDGEHIPLQSLSPERVEYEVARARES